MKKLKLSLVAVIGSFLILGASYTFANSDLGIGDFFKEKKNKVESNSEDIHVVTSDDFTITGKEYIDYEENINLVQKLNNISFSQNEEELVQQMIDNRLLLHYAKKQNIVVADEEVMNYALQTKEAFENTSSEMKELLNHMANSLEVSTDDYFTHPKTLKNYKESLMVQKAIEQLYEEGILDDEIYTLDLFIKDLKKDKQDKIIVDLEKIKEHKAKKNKE